MRSLKGFLLPLVLVTACDRSLPTEPRESSSPTPIPTVSIPNVRGSWRGTVEGSLVCREVSQVGLTLEESGSEVSGTFHGGCLDGKTLSGHLTGVSLVAQAGPYTCPGSGGIVGIATSDRLTLSLTVTLNLDGGCTHNILFVSDRVRIQLER